MARGDDGAWLYHLPEFLDEVREAGGHSLRENLDVAFGGVLYHHRGARVPAHNATFVAGGALAAGSGPADGSPETFDLELDAVGSRSAWVRFDATRDWDFFLVRAAGDAPCLAWMSDEEFRVEEAPEHADKRESVAVMRFSFGVYLQPPDVWADVEARAAATDAPCFVYRPGGRTLVPEGDLAEYASVLPAELLDGDAPSHLGVVEAHVESE